MVSATQWIEQGACGTELTADLYRFGSWELDLARRRVMRRGEVVALRRKVFEVLAYFVRHPGRLVTREELLAAVWPGVSVCDTTLATTIHEVRSRLAKVGDHDAWLRTAHGHGYIFEAQVECLPSDSASAASARKSHSLPGQGFVGREKLIAEIEAGLGRACRGFGHAFFVVGGVGAGKSSVLLEVAGRADDCGFAVHSTRCLEDRGAPPAWPWAQLLRSLLGACPDGRRLALETRFPEALEILPEHAAHGRRGPRSERSSASWFRRFDALAAVLYERACERPVLLVLDDLQHVDTATVQLLRHVSLNLSSAPVVVLGALRADDLPADHALEAIFSELHGIGRVIPLGPLELSEVGELAAAVAGQAPKLEVTLALQAHTGGNPFLVVEIARALAAAGMLDDAEAVKRAVPRATHRLGARLAPLDLAGVRLPEGEGCSR